MKADNTIKDKSLDFAIRIVRLYKHISETNNEYILSKQLLKSGTSIGANVREAIGGQSKEDFIAKMHIALKEAYETEYWLELLYSTDYLAENEFKSIFTDYRGQISHVNDLDMQEIKRFYIIHQKTARVFG